MQSLEEMLTLDGVSGIQEVEENVTEVPNAPVNQDTDPFSKLRC
ncbi:hypothetical protein QO179_24410 [Bacillus stercoris]|nr:hypothetical protein [Bacillus stercoris]